MKEDLTNTYQLIPKESFGAFRFESNIRNYAAYTMRFIPKTDVNDLWDTYELTDPLITIYTDEHGTIRSIRSDSACFYREMNLIGLSYAHFLSAIQQKPDTIDRIYVPTQNSKGQYQQVYDFDDLGLQVWVHRGKIRTVFCNAVKDE